MTSNCLKEYKQLGLAQIEGNDFRNSAEFDSYFQQIIMMAYDELKAANKEKKFAYDQTQRELQELSQWSISYSLA